MLRDAECSQRQFAREVGVTPQQISNLLSGYSGVSLRLAVALERATQGRIRCADWLQAA